MPTKTPDLSGEYFERARFDPYSIHALECKHCGFSVEPIRSMGNFGRVSNMRKRMRDHIKQVHPSVLEVAIAKAEGR